MQEHKNVSSPLTWSDYNQGRSNGKVGRIQWKRLNPPIVRYKGNAGNPLSPHLPQFPITPPNLSLERMANRRWRWKIPQDRTLEYERGPRFTVCPPVVEFLESSDPPVEVGFPEVLLSISLHTHNGVFIFFFSLRLLLFIAEIHAKCCFRYCFSLLLSLRPRQSKSVPSQEMLWSALTAIPAHLYI